VDATGNTAATTWTKSLPEDTEFQGTSGLRLYRETTHFHSLVNYR
jgi:hypothetical protein